MTLESCTGYRERLEALHDGELPLDEQLALQEHLAHCAGCAYEFQSLERLRLGFHDIPPALGTRQAAPPESFAGNLLEQVRVERQLSWAAWLAGVFDDMHLVWPAIGATVAVLVCLVASAGVMHATAVQRPDSLAGIIDYLASPGSNVNPARLDTFTMVPRRHAAADWPLAGEDAVLALSTVVTREGRIQSIEMLAAEQARGQPDEHRAEQERDRRADEREHAIDGLAAQQLVDEQLLPKGRHEHHPQRGLEGQEGQERAGQGGHQRQ